MPTASVAADDTLASGFSELIGHFCPVGDPSQYGNAATEMDYDPALNSVNHHYYFARFLLDYVGALNTPNSDAAPNVSTTTLTTAPECGEAIRIIIRHRVL